MSKNSDQLPKPYLTAFNEAATNFGETARKYGEEAAKLPPGAVPSMNSHTSSTGIQSSTTTHDSVKTYNGQVVAEEHWTTTTGDVPPPPHDH